MDVSERRDGDPYSYRVKQGVAARGTGAPKMDDTTTRVITDHGWRCAMHTETPIEAL